MVQIIPAILATTEDEFGRDISCYKQATSFKEGWIHFDLMDNLFVQNQSIKPSDIARCPISLHKEVHLMVTHPIEWVNDLVKAGIERILFHLEIKDDVLKCIEYIKNKGLQVGLTLKNETPITSLTPYADKIDAVLLMSVVPGLQGQPFIPEVISKIEETSRLRSKNNYNFKIGVDGGVRDANIKQLVDAGADFVIVGSYLLKGDIDENLENLWEVINGTEG